MADARSMEYFLLRYSPEVTGSAEINVGVVLFERVGKELRFAKARFTEDMERILKFDEDADIEMLAAIFRDIETRLSRPAEAEETLGMIQDTFSNTIVVSDSKGVLVSDEPESALESLAAIYIV
jgi:hypothetical protein